MRNRLLFLSAFALALTVTNPLHAQFQDPTPEELHMTSDPKAPGAAAVYLYVEEKTDDAVHYHSYYVRIKVLTEKGKELATVHVPYEHGQFSVAAIHGRTIHADGTVVPLQAKPTDLMSFRAGGRQFNDMTFTLPAVEVGSILEYYLQLRYSEDSVSSPEWVVQQPYFVHKAHYFFNPVFNVGEDVVDKHGQVAAGLMYSTRLPFGGHVAEDTRHRYTLDVVDVPPMPSGDYLPPLNNVRGSVVFFYTSAGSGPQFWDQEGKYWQKNVEKFAAASGPVKKAATEMVAAGDTDEAKARKIYAAVMKIENTDFSGGSAGSKSKGNKDAAGVLKQQRGDSTDIALTYVALARAVGLRAWPMWVVNRDRAAFEPTNLSTEQLDDTIVVVQLGGKDVYLDPGEKMCGFGVLHWKHELTKGLRMSEKGVSIEETPAGPPKAAAIRRFAELTLDAQGTVTGKARMELGGQEALLWRQVALVETKDEVAKDFSEWLGERLPAGVKGELEGFDGLEDYEKDLVAHIKFSGTLGSATAKRLIVPAHLFEAREKQLFVDEQTRSVPVDLHYATMEEDEVTYHLPDGMKVSAAPQDDSREWAGRIGFQVSVQQSAGAVTVKRRFVRTAAVIDAGLYGNLRYMYQRIATADQQPVVFERATETAGN